MSDTQTIPAPHRLRGSLAIPGDKSISHRAVLLNACARGTAEITNFLDGEDCLRTVACMQALGVHIERTGTSVRVVGQGIAALHEPADVLDCGNSGTTLRLLAGLLAGLPFFSVLTGDDSLRSRPQQRVVAPLRALGATLDGRADADRAPLAIRGRPLAGGAYTLPIASAQVKSALLLAGLNGSAPLKLNGRLDSRDHTERMLVAMGVDIGYGLESLILYPLTHDPQRARLPRPLSLRVPGDPSSAAFWWVAATVHPDAEITTTGVCMNPTRTGALDALRLMGADIRITNERTEGNEPVADVTVCSAQVHATTIGGELIPRLIDELPVLAVAAACATGQTVIRDAAELRVKETDRIATVVAGLRALGVGAEATPDGMTVLGKAGHKLLPATLSSHGDHRLAMAWAVAALLTSGTTTITGADAVHISYPGFWTALHALCVPTQAAR